MFEISHNIPGPSHASNGWLLNDLEVERDAEKKGVRFKSHINNSSLSYNKELIRKHTMSLIIR